MEKILKFQSVSLSWKKFLDDFILTKKVEGCRDRTIKDYVYHISLFFNSYPKAFEEYFSLKSSVMEYFSKKCAPATCIPKIIITC